MDGASFPCGRKRNSSRKINPSGICEICGARLQPILVPRQQDNGEAYGENETALEAVVAFSEIERTRDQTLAASTVGYALILAQKTPAGQRRPPTRRSGG